MSFISTLLMPKSRSFGKNVDQANEVARIVNAKLSEPPSQVKEILSSLDDSFTSVLTRFAMERVPEFNWSPSYEKLNLKRIDSFIEYGGEIRCSETDVRFFSNMIETLFHGESQRTALCLLNRIEEYALGKGYRTGNNICKALLSRPKQKRRRPRIDSIEEFEKIRNQAEPWLKDIMDFALATLLPREVLCSLNFSMLENNQLKVHRGKTGCNLKIYLNEALLKFLHRRKKIAFKYGTRNVFFRPSAKPNLEANISPERLSREFTRAAIETGIYTKALHPTFHEIRSLGARLYAERGHSDLEIKDLMGHKRQSTTEIYLESDEPRYVTVSAALQLPFD